MADNQKLGGAQRFGNRRCCMADVQICIAWVMESGLAACTFVAGPHHCTGTFSLKINRGSMNLRVR